MLLDSRSFIWDIGSFPLWHSSQNIAECQNFAGTPGLWESFTFSEIILLDFVKILFYNICILD